MVETKIATKNIIVEYKGGGYDGCFWEWNFFLFDSNGEFHNLYTSGRNGVKNESEALELLKDESEIAVYHLDNHEEMQHFQNGINAGNLHSLMKLVNGEIDCPEIWFKCPCCENEVTETVLDPDNYCGDGGIGVVYHGLYCEDCFSSGTCSECGSFSNELLKNGGCLCEHCLESKLKKYIEEMNDQGGIFLEFNSRENKWTEIDDPEFEVSDLDSEEPLFNFTVKRSGETVEYFLNGKNEKTALDDLAWFLKGDYCEISDAVKIDRQAVENES